MVMHSEWDIATHSAELYLAQIKQWDFVPECCKQNSIFQLQAIQANYIVIICRQTGDLWSVSSMNTAAAKWQLKNSR